MSDAFNEPLAVGESVLVTAGPFSDLLGTVDQVDAPRRRVRVVVDRFGRGTFLELDFVQVEKQ